MRPLYWIALCVLAFVILTPARHLVLAIPGWIEARRRGMPMSLRKLAGYSLAKAPPRRLVSSYARLVTADVSVELGEVAVLEASGVNTDTLARVVEARRSAGLPVEFYGLSAVALEGELDAFGMSPNPVKSMTGARSHVARG